MHARRTISIAISALGRVPQAVRTAPDTRSRRARSPERVVRSRSAKLTATETGPAWEDALTRPTVIAAASATAALLM
mgnify:CR=1 FL=1